VKEIRHIISSFDNTDHSEEKLALASVVKVEQSSYRRIGARMLVGSTGNWVGGISGGCLEGDALRRSQQAIYKNISSKVVYDTLDDEKNEIGIGLGCNGRIEVLFTPIDPNNPNNQIEQLRQAVESGKPAILLKVIEAKSDHSILGKTLLTGLDLKNLMFCGISGTQFIDAVKETRLKRRPQLLKLTDKDSNELQVLVEYVRPETKLVIIGDNYDVISFVGIAVEMGWEIHVVGRKKKMSKSIFANSKSVYEYEDYQNVPIDEYTAVVLMSHDYNHDKELLPYILKQNLSYIGMLGPRKRLLKMENDIGQDNIDKLNYFFSPVGLDIGAESPEEIALSIAAEIVAVLRKREGGSLKFRKGTIHDHL